MAFKIKQLDPQAQLHTVTAEERLWLDADRERLVPEGHEDAAFLFCVPGQVLPLEDAEKYGLAKKKPAKKGS